MANISSVKLPDNSEYNFEDVVSAKGTNPNLLINPWFTVNQRGFTSSTGVTDVYTVDRWSIEKSGGTGGQTTQNSNGTIKLVGGSSDNEFQSGTYD